MREVPLPGSDSLRHNAHCYHKTYLVIFTTTTSSNSLYRNGLVFISTPQIFPLRPPFHFLSSRLADPGEAQRPGLTLAAVQLAASGRPPATRLTGGLNPPHRWALILLRRKETITLLCFGSALRSAPAERAEKKQPPPAPTDHWGGVHCKNTPRFNLLGC